MKRLLILLGLLVLVAVVQAGGSYDYQNPSDFSEHVTCYAGACTWEQNTTGGNSYVETGVGYMTQLPGELTQYAAITQWIAIGNTNVQLLDSSFHTVGSDIYCNYHGTIPSPYRCELIIAGGEVKAYANGINDEHGTMVDWTGTNPSYVAFRYAVDDGIWGNNEPRYIFGMPATGNFLMKDILNSAASGFYQVNSTDPNGTPTLLSSTRMTSTFGKNNGNDETVEFSSPTGGVQMTYSTGTAYAGKIYWNITQLFENNAPYGLYQTTIDPQLNSTGFAASDFIPYIGSGAFIQFDKNSYAIGETATLTVLISDSYYDAVEDPHVVIMDIYGTEINDDTVLSFTELPSHDWEASSTYTWASDDDEGVYFGLIYATTTSDGEEVLMNYDTADLDSTLLVDGYVKDAETALVISGAVVNITQGSTTDSNTTAASGFYTSSSDFSTNAPTSIEASAVGYETYTHTFTPLIGGEIQINITLMPTSPTYSGVALGGIARSPPYNRTVDSARVDIVNSTDGHVYNATTNAAGYYIQNDMADDVASHWYNVWGSKTGFSNSTIYQKLVVGV